MFANLKICGLTTRQAVQSCASYACGYNGFIAHPPSPRHVTAEQAASLQDAVHEKSQRVLVTVNADDAMLDSYTNVMHPTMLQLHGNESPQRCADLMQTYHLPIIKAFHVREAADINAVKRYVPYIAMALFDTARLDGTSGGTGVVFNWSILDGFNIAIPYFLSGGIGEHNIADALASGHCSYLDVSSALESHKGIKDCDKIDSFMKRLAALHKTH